MKHIILSIIALAGCNACQSDFPPKAEEASIDYTQLTEVEKQIVERNNAFAFDLLCQVAKTEKLDSNILLSPLSASLALAMLNNGAVGQTSVEIQQTLGYGNFTTEEVNVYYQKMLALMKETDLDVSFESANSIWIEKTFPVLEPFKETNRKFYDAEIQNVDFSNGQAILDQINSWGAEKTRGKIPDILQTPPFPPIVLANALYFKGTWTLPFEKVDTKDSVFHNSNGTASVVPFMKMDKYLNWGKKEKFEILELPYGNESFCMTILLPNKEASLASVIEDLDASTLSQISPLEIRLKFPRFKIEYSRTLNDDLQALGMKSMFSTADFSLIHPTASLAVSGVVQKTFAEVNEEGTEAAAITVVSMVGSAGYDGPPIGPIEFYIDRPFAWFIREKNTKIVFFTGIVNQL